MTTQAQLVAICADGKREWKANARRYQRSLAEVAAARPRKVHEYYGFGLEPDLQRMIRTCPSDVALCWPIIRALCWYLRGRRLAAAMCTPASRYYELGGSHGVSIENACIQIRAELLRMAAARRQRRPLLSNAAE